MNLDLIPVVNKIDLPSADPDKVAMEIEQIIGLPAEDCINCSAKTGEGHYVELLDLICSRLPAPEPRKVIKQTRALNF